MDAINMFHSVVFSNDLVGIKKDLNCRLQDNDISKISKIQKDVNFDKSIFCAQVQVWTLKDYSQNLIIYLIL